jgi:hypothetical protein
MTAQASHLRMVELQSQIRGLEFYLFISDQADKLEEHKVALLSQTTHHNPGNANLNQAIADLDVVIARLRVTSQELNTTTNPAEHAS